GSPIMNQYLNSLDYELDGVKVSRFPIQKKYPHADYSDKELNKQFLKIVKKLEENAFYPDVIIGHWESPQIPLVAMLKEHYNAKSAIVLHLFYKAYILKNNKINRYIDDLKKIDAIGFRSKILQQQFEQEFWKPQQSFICYSGIP